MVMPTDEEIGQAVLEAARYGDLEDLKELHQNYGRPHFDHKGAGDNTALHYGEYNMVSSVMGVCSCLRQCAMESLIFIFLDA